MTRRAVGGVLASAALISVLTVAARITGFGRWLALSGTVGATCVGNAYASVNLLPNLLFEVMAGGALAAAVIPVLRGFAGPGADRVASALLTWTLLVLAPVSLGLAVFAGPLARAVIGVEDCAGQHAMAARMLVVFAPQVLLYGVGVVLTGVLQARHRFAGPAVAPLLSSLVVIVAYLGYGAAVGGRGGEVTGVSLPAPAFAWLAWGTTIGVVVLTLPLLIPVGRAGIRLRPELGFPDGVARRVLRLTASGVAAVVAQQLFLLVVMLLANRRGLVGAYLVYGYTQAVALLPHAVLVVPLVTAVFPRLVARAGPGESFAAPTARYARAVLVAGATGAALLAATAPGVAALFAALDQGSVADMGAALLAAAPGVAGLALLTYGGRVLFALEASRAAAVATGVGWGTAIVAAPIAVTLTPGEHTVVALSGAGSVGMLAGAVALLVAVRRAAGRTALAGLARTAAVALPAAVLAGGVGWLVARRLVAEAPSGSVGGALGAGVIAAVAALAVFAVPVVVFDRGAIRLDPAGRPADRASGPGPGPVLLVLGSSGGGIGRHVRSVAEGLAGRGVPVTVAAPASTLGTFALAAVDGVQAAPVPIGERPHPLHDLATIRRLRALAAEAAVLHAHGLRAGALAVLACTGRATPVVVTLHNALVASGPTAVVYRGLERIVARRAAQVLVVSADLGERMRDLGAAAVQRALVPAPPRAATSADRGVVRAGLGVAEGEVLLVTVARLAEQKGLPTLLDAVAQLTDLPIRAVVAGDGPLRAGLESDIAGRALPVHLLGRRDDIADLLAAADVVVVPSLWEGQPLIVQEALAAGAAIVATDAGGTGEVAGDAAVLVPAQDPVALAVAVRGLIEDPHGAPCCRIGRGAALSACPPTPTRWNR